MFKSTTDLKKKRTPPPPATDQSRTNTSSELKQRKPYEENRNQRLKNATTQTINCQQNISQQNKGYSGANEIKTDQQIDSFVRKEKDFQRKLWLL